MRQTGKTSLSKGLYKLLMESYTDAVGYIIDSNASGDFTGWSGGYFGFEPPIIGPGPKGRQLVWQPPYDNRDAYEDFFRRLYDAGIPAVLFIDELSCLGGGDNHEYYARLLKRGRARPNFPGISVISLSQELAQKAKVPRQTFSQLTHFIRFYVQHPYDLLEANKIAHLPQRVQPEHAHGFWHVSLESPPIKPTYYAGKEVLGL